MDLQHTICVARTFVITFVFCIYSTYSFSQTKSSITIEECYAFAEANYPLIHQQALLTKLKEYNLDNAAKGRLPQVSLNSQITYQSDVTTVPVDLPGLNIPSLSKDQYKAYIEVAQPLTEGKMIHAKERLIEANAIVEDEKNKVELYQLKDRVNQLYFGILLMRDQSIQIDLMKNDLQSGLVKTNAAIKGGIALKSGADLIKAELIKADQRTIEMNVTLDEFIQMLSLLIHQSIDAHTTFIVPKMPDATLEILRPELRLFVAEQNSIQSQLDLIRYRNIPKVSLFLQGGYGKPGFNFLENKFDFYYIGGVRFNWPLNGYYTYTNDRQILILNQHMVDIKRETFLLNTSMSITKQSIEAQKYAQLIDADQQIIALYESVIKAYAAQLESGTITSDVYISHINAVDIARQNMSLHTTQLLQTEFNQVYLTGN